MHTSSEAHAGNRRSLFKDSQENKATQGADAGDDQDRGEGGGVDMASLFTTQDSAPNTLGKCVGLGGLKYSEIQCQNLFI